MHEHKFAHILRVGNTIVASPVLLYASPASAEISRPDLRNIEGETAAVASVTTVDKLANDMAEAILSGEFAPGYRLDEQLLAQRYNVSRTPVREALRQLATTGLIEIRPRRGAIVAQVTPAQLEELFVAMAELEATCARLAAMSMSPMERRRLQALHERMGDPARQRDAKVFADDNHLLHTMIYAGAHNNVLEELATAMRRRLSPFRRAQFQLEGRPPRSFAEHDAVVTAIVAGNPGAAHAAMLHHVTLIEQSYEELSKPVL